MCTWYTWKFFVFLNDTQGCSLTGLPPTSLLTASATYYYLRNNEVIIVTQNEHSVEISTAFPDFEYVYQQALYLEQSGRN